MTTIHLNTVYNYYLTTYHPTSNTSSRYDTHQKSELRNIYTSIIKLNKEAHLYLPNNTTLTHSYVINLKENARNFKNTIASLGGVDDSSIMNRKIAISSDTNIATASCLGGFSSEVPTLFDLTIENLATPQENLGKFLPNEKTNLPEDSYSFDLQVLDMNYELQFEISPEDTNKDIQYKLKDLLNNANIGIIASVIEENDLSALKFTSTSSGLPVNNDLIFHVADNKTSDIISVVNYFGLDCISSQSQDAIFTINEERYSSNSNHFQLENTYELTLHNISKDSVVKIGLKADFESLSENISDLLAGYNTFISSATDSNGHSHGRQKLLTSLTNLTSIYQQDLSTLGIHTNTSGALSFDQDIFKLSLSTEDSADNSLSILKQFASALLQKSTEISLDPMAYTDRTIAAYKNPHITLAAPYITSAYSGMLFNSYC